METDDFLEALFLGEICPGRHSHLRTLQHLARCACWNHHVPLAEHKFDDFDVDLRFNHFCSNNTAKYSCQHLHQLRREDQTV